MRPRLLKQFQEYLSPGEPPQGACENHQQEAGSAYRYQISMRCNSDSVKADPDACHPDLDTVIRQLEKDFSVIIKWFSDNLLKLNDEKCHLMIYGDKSTETTTTIRNSKN